tara:strand:- start:225 stop:680 length:456 start_codon:yes stop_codon:yes gene_type:complete
MNVQELVINLKVISSLGINQKLITKDIILNVEPLSIIPEFARRWLRQDNREESIKKIDNVVDQSIEYLKKSSDQNKKNTNTELDSTVFYDCTNTPKTSQSNNINLIHYLIESKKGLDNLKKTYSPCIQTVSKIDWIIDKIDNIVNSETDKI